VDTLNQMAVLLQVTERKDGAKRVLTLRQEKFTADGSADSMSCLLTFSLGLERYWHWTLGYWAIFADIG